MAVTLAVRYKAADGAPFTPPWINPKRTAAYLGGGCALAAVFTLPVVSPFVASALTTGAILPAAKYGYRYPKWLNQLAAMAAGEVKRHLLKTPDAAKGIQGWQQFSQHSHHVSPDFADAVIEMCQAKMISGSAAIYDLAGNGDYLPIFQKQFTKVTAYDFSRASAEGAVQHTTTTDREYQFELVFSPSDVMSKGTEIEQEQFVQKMVCAAALNGTIVVTCAVPGQPGPNCTPLSNEEAIAKFTTRGCEYDEEATMKLRRLADPMHSWLEHSILVFRKTTSIA